MRKSRWCMIVVFWGIIGLVSMAGWIAADKKFSENENRYLEELPQVGWGNFINGSYQEHLETYLNDQIFGRDAWISLKTGIQKACGDTDIGGAYVGKDGYDFEKITPEDVDDKLFSRNIKASVDFFAYCRGQGIEEEKLCFLLVPTSGLIYKENLPAYARMFDQQECIDRVRSAMVEYNYIDVVSALLEQKDTARLFYRTDHHWTSEGALIGYEQWCGGTGRVFEEADYEREEVTDRFRGSLYSKILDVDSAYDTISVFKKKGAMDKLQITEDGTQVDSFYEEKKLQEKDKYAYFFGGNYGQVHIHNGNGTGNLLMIKDSFANCFVPFLAEEYANIYMIDLRYFKGNMKNYVGEQEITEVLMLYNISNFLSDKNIYILNR